MNLFRLKSALIFFAALPLRDVSSLSTFDRKTRKAGGLRRSNVEALSTAGTTATATRTYGTIESAQFVHHHEHLHDHLHEHHFERLEEAENDNWDIDDFELQILEDLDQMLKDQEHEQQQQNVTVSTATTASTTTTGSSSSSSSDNTINNTNVSPPHNSLVPKNNNNLAQSTTPTEFTDLCVSYFASNDIQKDNRITNEEAAEFFEYLCKEINNCPI